MAEGHELADSRKIKVFVLSMRFFEILASNPLDQVRSRAIQGSELAQF
jgi:hypothetical protein